MNLPSMDMEKFPAMNRGWMMEFLLHAIEDDQASPKFLDVLGEIRGYLSDSSLEGGGHLHSLNRSGKVSNHQP